MNETEQYIANAIRLWVWSGLYTPDQARDNIQDILDEDADEQMLSDLVEVEFARKREAEAGWPAVTDCDKLDRAFVALRGQGFVAIHNAGWDKAEGLHNCLEAYRKAGSPSHIHGLCYYTTQDLEGAIDSEALYLGYGSTVPEDEQTNALRAGRAICAAVTDAGLRVEWDGTTAQRIKVLMRWQNRAGGSSPSPGTVCVTPTKKRGLMGRVFRVLGLRPN